MHHPSTPLSTTARIMNIDQSHTAPAGASRASRALLLLLRLLLEASIGGFLLVAIPAALYSTIKENLGPSELAERLLRVSLALALGVALWMDAWSTGTQLKRTLKFAPRRSKVLVKRR